MPRRLTLRTGRLFASAERAEAGDVACALLDESPGGACLLVPKYAEVPDIFVLVLDGGGDQLICSVKWRSGCRIGVAVTKASAE